VHLSSLLDNDCGQLRPGAGLSQLLAPESGLALFILQVGRDACVLRGCPEGCNAVALLSGAARVQLRLPVTILAAFGRSASGYALISWTSDMQNVPETV
jgi:hypothetical protein